MSHFLHELTHFAPGIAATDIARETANIASVATALQQAGQRNEVAAFTLPHTRSDLPEITRWAQRLQDRYSHVVILGTGGSSLGAKMLSEIRQPRYTTSSQQLHYVENSDSHSLLALLSELPLADSCFLAISKSGSTTETMLAALVVAQHLRDNGFSAAEQMIAVTMPGDRPLRRLAESLHMPVLDHDPAIGGRFSVLSLVGLLPAALAGWSIEALREGAAQVQREFDASPHDSPSAQAAVLHALHMRAGRTISVVMPYCDRLQSFGSWYRQLWAESLGKDGKGSTPIRALGTVDQHSQLQLYLDGPRDKVITMLRLAHDPAGLRVDRALAQQANMECLAGHDIANIIDAQQRATAESMRRAGLPLREITLPNLEGETIGALLQHYMLETALTAGLIGVDAFDQPAVEESKQLTRENLAAA